MPTEPRARHETPTDLLRRFRREANIALARERLAAANGSAPEDVDALREAWMRADALADAIIAGSDGSDRARWLARLEAQLWLNGGLTAVERRPDGGDEAPLPGNPDAVDLGCLLADVADFESLAALGDLGTLISWAARREFAGRPDQATFALDVIARFGEKLTASADERLEMLRPANRADAVARTRRLIQRTLATGSRVALDDALDVAARCTKAARELPL